MKKAAYLVIVLLALCLISGCGTVPKKFQSEVSDIKTRVDTLEMRVEGVETKTADVERMSSEQARAIEDMKSRPVSGTNVTIKNRSASKSQASVRDIQTCLKNAGFYSGKIDGVKGRQTRKAIRDFQEANSLKVDGVVGPKTWNVLSGYTSAVAGQGYNYAEEGASTK